MEVDLSEIGCRLCRRAPATEHDQFVHTQFGMVVLCDEHMELWLGWDRGQAMITALRIALSWGPDDRELIEAAVEKAREQANEAA